MGHEDKAKQGPDGSGVAQRLNPVRVHLPARHVMFEPAAIHTFLSGGRRLWARTLERLP